MFFSCVLGGVVVSTINLSYVLKTLLTYLSNLFFFTIFFSNNLINFKMKYKLIINKITLATIDKVLLTVISLSVTIDELVLKIKG